MHRFKLSTHEFSDKYDPTWSEVQYYVDILRSTHGAFLTLEAEPWVDNVTSRLCGMFQAPNTRFSVKKPTEAPHYIVEVQTAGIDESLYMHIHKTQFQAEVETVFENYLNNSQPPDLNGWGKELF